MEPMDEVENGYRLMIFGMVIVIVEAVLAVVIGYRCANDPAFAMSVRDTIDAVITHLR